MDFNPPVLALACPSPGLHSREQVAQTLTPPPDTTPRQTNLTLNIKTTDQVVMEVASKVEEDWNRLE